MLSCAATNCTGTVHWGWGQSSEYWAAWQRCKHIGHRLHCASRTYENPRLVQAGRNIWGAPLRRRNGMAKIGWRIQQEIL